jgi:hypothetical protein
MAIEFRQSDKMNSVVRLAEGKREAKTLAFGSRLNKHKHEPPKTP